MRLHAENGTNYIKSSDNGSHIKIQVIDNDNSPMNLTEFSNVQVKIGDKNGSILVITPELVDENGFVEFTLTDSLQNGEYLIEVYMYNSDESVRIAPSNSSLRFTVTKSLDELGILVNAITVTELLSKVNEAISLADGTGEISSNAVTIANNAVDIATMAEVKVNLAIDVSEESNIKSTQAVNDSNEALRIANESTELSEFALSNSDEAFLNSDEALRIANESKILANQSKTSSDIAVSDSNIANVKSDKAILDSGDALTKANKAITDSASAITTANSTISKSDKAILDSSEALTKANKAITDSGTALTNSNSANTKSDNSVTTANSAKTMADASKVSSDKAIVDSATALTNSNKAITDSTTAMTTSNSANTKSDKAITDSASALTNSNKAITDSTSALSKATNAENVANLVRSEFDELTDGSTDAQVIAAKTNASNVTFDNLKARLDDSDVKINNKVEKVNGKDLSDTNFTQAEKTKLTGVQDNANNYTLPVATASVFGGVKSGTNITNTAGVISIVNATTTVKGVVQLENSTTSTSTTTAATPSSVKTAFDLANGKAGTTIATTTANGLMSSTDKTKLNGLANTVLTDTINTTSSTVGASATAVKTAYDLANSKQSVLTTEQTRKITISTSNPSGGVNGDIWFKYE